MNRKDAINHVLYNDGDAGLSSANHPEGFRIDWDASKPDVRTWTGAYQRAIIATRNGNPVSIDRTPGDGWRC